MATYIQNKGTPEEKVVELEPGSWHQIDSATGQVTERPQGYHPTDFEKTEGRPEQKFRRWWPFK